MEETGTFNIATEVKFPRGLKCMRCSRPISNGMPYVEAIVSLGPGAPADADLVTQAKNADIWEIICVYCVGETD